MGRRFVCTTDGFRDRWNARLCQCGSSSAGIHWDCGYDRISLSVGPIPWTTRRMRNGNDNDAFLIRPVNQLIREPSHQIEAVPVVANRESFGIFCNCFQSAIELCIKSLRCGTAAFGVPAQGLGKFFLGCGRKDDVTHQDRPADALGNAPPARAKFPCGSRQSPSTGAVLRRRHRHPEQPIHREGSSPTRRE